MDTRTDPAQDDLTVPQLFERFHQANPHIYRALVTHCRDYARNGRRPRFGIRAPWERLRWDLSTRTDRPADDYKLNDRYAPYYARLIAHQEPDLAGVFETRRAPEADEWAAQLPRPRTAQDGTDR